MSGYITTASREEDIFRSSPVMEIMHGGAIVVTITCIALAISSFVRVEKATVNIRDIATTWTTLPVCFLSSPA